MPEASRPPRGLIPRAKAFVRDLLGRGQDDDVDARAGRRALVERLRTALESHDLDAMVECFHRDYSGEQPLHPSAGKIDRDQLRRNWETFFGDVPDLSLELLDTAESDDAIWTEWRIWGTRRDGEPMDLRSVWIVGIRDDRIAWSRLYREPIHSGEESTVDETIERLTRPQ